MSESSFSSFQRSAPELATAGRRLLVGADGVAIGYLATASPAGAVHLSPVCPVFCGDDLYLIASLRTVKVRDLRRHGAYALHAFLGADDEEFQISGVAAEVRDPEERAAVHEAVPFAAFERGDPIFRLGIERALWVWWENAGRPDTRPVRQRWPAR
ncbi:MAG: pyridoxamine 5'-phosphate oxidase family protein [Myxococcales bacterium]|nr:pyridoxamine 5'-phosphate oxidase family protein [Myxococcales bacterium]